MPFNGGPQVESVYPLNSSESVSTLVTIEVKFTKVMSSETLTPDYIYIRPYGDTTHKINSEINFKSGDSSTVLIKPLDALEYNNQYEIIVIGEEEGSGIKDSIGYPMLETFTSSFTTKVEEDQEDNNGDEDLEEIEIKPYVLSSYPKDGQYNISPFVINIKIDNSEDIDLSGITVGTEESYGDFNLVKGSISEKDIEDIDIIPFEYVEGELEVNGNIIKFTPTGLKQNTTYNIILTGKIQEHIIKFHSEFEHFYGDFDLIKESLSRYIKISDWLLARQIAIISEDAYTIATRTYGDSIEWGEERPYFIDEYVRYKTAFELTNTKYVELTTGSNLVTLGNFTIQNSVSLRGLAAFIDGAKLHLKKWEDALHGRFGRGYARPSGVSKKTSQDHGEGYPEYMDRRFRDLEGTKED